MTQRFGIEPQLIKGKGGIFDVTLDGELIYSKHATGRFPEPGEVEEALAESLPAAV